MKKIYSLIAILTLGTSLINAQCTGNRYKEAIFVGTDLVSDVVVGSNIDRSGSTQELNIDVYTGTGDTETNRPLLIMAHGGSFIGGSKTGSDVVPLCQDFAQMGYVSASMEYRLGMDIFNLDSVTATEAVIRGYHDMKGVIRFFYKNAREDGNTYGIDTNQIYISGVSAGALVALHVAYLDEIGEMPSYVDYNQPGLGGGLEGTSGSQGYPETVQGVVNIAGAIKDTSWIKPGDLPLMSFHGDQDGTVPFGTAQIALFGSDIIEVDGSNSINTRALNIGLPTCFEVHEGQDHVPHNGDADYYDTTFVFMRNFLSELVCGESMTCEYTSIATTVNELTDNNFVAYPNPITSVLNLDFAGLEEGTKRISVLDATGRLVKTENTIYQKHVLNLEELDRGNYFIHVKGNNWTSVKKIVK